MCRWLRQSRARNGDVFHNSPPVQRQCVAHQPHCPHFHKEESCVRRGVRRRLLSRSAQYRSGWSQLRLEKFPDALGESSLGELKSRSLISLSCCPRCNSLRQSKKAPLIIIGVSARSLSFSDKFG